jgi:feruloyl esterase
MSTKGRSLAAASLAIIACAVAGSASAAGSLAAPPSAKLDASGCAALTSTRLAWPDPSTKVLTADWRPAGADLPAHCELKGVVQERIGVDGEVFRIGFHLRLPADWRGRFLFQGGSGSNGALGDAAGRVASGGRSVLEDGYAVVSQDSGHDNATNARPDKGGLVAFGFDPKARANYGHASLKIVSDLAKAAIVAAYASPPRYAYFVGCSKGGQEGMMLAQRYPDLFDGIIASAPGMSLPRAALAEAWDTKAFLTLVSGEPTIKSLAATLGESDLRMIGESILAACDDLDGLKDGMVLAYGRCTSARVAQQLKKRACGKSSAECLSPRLIEVMLRVMAGPRDSRGKSLYADWAWDPGLTAAGWRMWKIGGRNGAPPALNVILGLPSLGAVFSTPPVALKDHGAAMAFAAGYDFDRQAQAIYAKGSPFKTSAWEDVGARSIDLSAFIRRGGKLLSAHGVADPVFSVNDTTAWFKALDDQQQGRAANNVRVFPVPGMNHCAGGPTTDQYPLFEALVTWVEQHAAPDRIVAQSGAGTPWPGRTRPLCPFPATAVYVGGNAEDERSFVCRRKT